MSKPKAPDYKPMAEAQKYAADLQYKAAQEALALWKEQYAQQREDFRPYRERGIEVMAEIKAGSDAGRWHGEEWEGTDPLPTWEGGGLDLPEWAETSQIPQWDNPLALPTYQEATEVPEWEGAGKYALTDFDSASVNIEEDPGYQFRLSEGLKAIRRQGAAGSGARGGSTMKALTRYGQGMASQEYRSAYDRAIGRYRMDRENVMARRGMARDDYLLDSAREAEMRRRAVERYGFERADALTMREAELTDYEILRQNEDRARQRALQGYGINRMNLMDERSAAMADYSLALQHAQMSRGQAVQDHAIRQQQLQRDYQNLLAQANIGYSATAGGVHAGAQNVGQQANAIMTGASALGAGEIGAQSAMIRQQEMQYAAAQQSFNNFMQMVGLGAGAAAAFSDRQLKTDIEVIGTTDNGLPIYRFKFLGEDKTRVGLMADDVEKVVPEAVTEEGGIKMVDYDKAIRAYREAA